MIEKNVDPEEIKFLFVSPLLDSEDLQRDLKWYEEKLRFKNVYDSSHYKAGPIDYAVIGRQNLYLHLQFQYPKDVKQTRVKFEVLGIEALFQQCVAAGIIYPDRIKRQTDWNTTEFGVLDPSGNKIIFIEDLEKTVT